MGQAETKQLQHIATSVERIRRNSESGTITGKQINKCQENLRRYSRDLEKISQKSHLTSEITNIENLISLTDSELGALAVQEADLDAAAVPTNSFKRGSTKNSSKKKSKQVEAITKDVEKIRELIQNKKVEKDDYDNLEKALIGCSQQLSKLINKAKKEEINEGQKLISSVIKDLITLKESEEKLNDSKEEKASVKPSPKPQQQTQKHKIINVETSPTLVNIEQKLETLQKEIKVASDNNDKNQLRFLSKSIETLMTDLQLMQVDESIKVPLEKKLARSYHHIEKIKKQLSTENNIKYLTELQAKEKREKALQNLQKIQNGLSEICENINHQNLKISQEKHAKFSEELNMVEETDPEIHLKKQEISELLKSVKEMFTKVEVEHKLDEVEQKRINSSFNKEGLEVLLKIVKQIPTSDNKYLEEKKQKIFDNINKDLMSLNERKAGEALNNMMKSWAVVETFLSNDCSANQRQQILSQLKHLKLSIEQKFNDGLPSINQEVQVVTIKEQMVEPLSNTIPSIDQQILDIRREVETIEEHIDSSRYTKDGTLYKDLKEKLESYRRSIEELSLGNRKLAHTVQKQLENALLLLENNAINRKSTSDEILQELMAIQTRIYDLGGKIQNIEHTMQDYGSIKSSLLDHQQYLKNLQISRINIRKSRDELLTQIANYLAILDNFQQNGDVATPQEQEFNHKLKKLKDKVSRFSGTYQNILYKTIEADLDKCLDQVDNVFSIREVAVEVKQDIINNKLILEQRSNKNENPQKLTEIQENLESVKQRLNTKLTNEELDKLDARLTLSLLALDNMQDLDNDRQKLYLEIESYTTRVKELKESLQAQEKQNRLSRDVFTAQTIAQVEEIFNGIKPRILNFTGSGTDPEFHELNEILIQNTLVLDSLKLDQTDEFYDAKVQLFGEIQKYFDILEERTQQVEELEELEKKVREMLIRIDSFNGVLGDFEYNSLDEEIIQLKIKLGKIQLDPLLFQKKDVCLREVDFCMKKLQSVARVDNIAGTLV